MIYDTINFDEPVQVKAKRSDEILNFCQHNTSDIVILQATRIVRRKNIEIAVDLVKTLSSQEFKNQLGEKVLAPNKRFDPATNKILLVLAGYAEKRDEGYKNQLLQYAENQGVSICCLGDLITSGDFTLFDAYPRADLITYPSEYEGFGNQFLEAVWANKPVALFEYPVFKTDIAPKGFDYISLGDTVTRDETGFCHVPETTIMNAAQKVVSLLIDSKGYQNLVGRNFNLGKENFSFGNTLKTLTKLLT